LGEKNTSILLPKIDSSQVISASAISWLNSPDQLINIFIYRPPYALFYSLSHPTKPIEVMIRRPPDQISDFQVY
jgi:hypothetical protein